MSTAHVGARKQTKAVEEAQTEAATAERGGSSERARGAFVPGRHRRACVPLLPPKPSRPSAAPGHELVGASKTRRMRRATGGTARRYARHTPALALVLCASRHTRLFSFSPAAGRVQLPARQAALVALARALAHLRQRRALTAVQADLASLPGERGDVSERAHQASSREAPARVLTLARSRIPPPSSHHSPSRPPPPRSSSWAACP